MYFHRVLVAICLIILSGAHGLAALAQAKPDTFTAAEKAQRERIINDLGRECRAMVNSPQPQEPNALGTIFREISNKHGYCDCVISGMRTSITPSVLRRNSKKEGATIGKNVSDHCMVAPSREAIPLICEHNLNTHLLVNDDGDRQLVTEVCGCVRNEVASASDENITKFIAQTLAMRNVDLYGLDPIEMIWPKYSMQGMLKQCGFGKARDAIGMRADKAP